LETAAWGARAAGARRKSTRSLMNALVDEEARPHALLLTGGQVAGIKDAAQLLSSTSALAFMIGDKGYDATHLRLFLESRGTTPGIPNEANRKANFTFNTDLYRVRNIIERTFCRLKGFRGIATRYDNLARNYLAARCLVAALCFRITWLRTLIRNFIRVNLMRC
jgi:transposase